MFVFPYVDSVARRYQFSTTRNAGEPNGSSLGCTTPADSSSDGNATSETSLASSNSPASTGFLDVSMIPCSCVLPFWESNFYSYSAESILLSTCSAEEVEGSTRLESLRGEGENPLRSGIASLILNQRTEFRSSMFFCFLLAAFFLRSNPAVAQTPNFGPNVYIFDTSMSDSAIQTQLLALSNNTQFSTNRYAVFFMPGTYTVQAQVGFYESVAGLGATPGAVTINGFLTPNYGSTSPGANLTTYSWRSMENLTINPATDTAQSAAANTLQWGVSQGAPLRRLQINGSLELADSYCGYASGGFISDLVVTGNVNSCSQQQWYSRNSSYGSWSGGVWNMVFSGVQGAPMPNYPSNVFTVLPQTPVSREKPFLYVDSSGNFNVFVPTVQTNSAGISWASSMGTGYSLPISSFFIAQPSTSLAAINTALAAGQNLILTPGIYTYSGAINVTNPDTIILGLGFADLVPQTGTAAITVADVDGVQIAGLLIDAGPVNSPVLLQIGVPNSTRVSHQSDPTSINDVFLRIGGTTLGTATTSIEVDSNNVILDDIWAWRADHGNTNTVGWTLNTAAHGLVVNGDNVIATGLAVEHYQQNQVIWNGNDGETIFYQSELPYDVPSQSAWMDGTANGYPSYAVSTSATSHQAYGLGVYSYFDEGLNIVEDNAITIPNVVGDSMTDSVTVFLSGYGSITANVNNVGTPVNSTTTTSYVGFYQGQTCTTTCPAAPSALTATIISPNQINLTWAASPTPGVLYSVYRSTTSGFTPSSNNQLASGVAVPSYADEGLDAATTYYYIVQAQNGAGISANSNVASATTPAAASGVIATNILEINAGGTAASSWVADEDFSGGSLGSTTSTINTSNVTNATAAPQAVYQSDRYGSFTYTIPGFTANGAYIVDLHFAELYSTAAGQREFNVLLNGTQVLTNFDIYATAGGQNIANVQPFLTNADSTGTITLQFVTGPVGVPQINGIEIGLNPVAAPVAASALTATSVSTSEIDLTWNASSTSGVQYEIFRSTTAGFTPSASTLIATVSPGTTTYSDSGLDAGTTYYYLVEANNSSQTSIASNQASAVTANGPPGAPFGLTAAVTSASQITLNWKASVTPGVQYQLYRSTTAGFTPSASTLILTTASLTDVDSSLASDTQYYYVVEANNSAGSSLPSSQASATTDNAPPTALSATAVSSSQINLSWTASTSAGVQYEIFRSTTAGFTPSSTTLIATTATGATTYTDSGLTAATQYFYLAEATNLNGTSLPSNQASATTANALVADFSIAIAPASLTVAPGSNGTATVTLTPVNGFAGNVSLACTGLPTGATCAFVQPNVMLAGGTASTATLTITVASIVAALKPNPGSRNSRSQGSHPWLPGSGLAIGLCFFCWKKRNSFRFLLLLLTLSGVTCGLTLLTGCPGLSPVPPTQQQPTSSTVTVTATSGALQHTTTITLTVQ